MTPHSPSDPVARPETGGGNAGPERKSPMPTCPMAETCKGMVGKPFSKFLLALPGLLFIAIGLLILVAPVILVWFIALTSIATGIMMLVFARFISRMGERFHRAHP